MDIRQKKRLTAIMSDMRRLTVEQDGSPCYEIVYTDSFDGLSAELEALGGKSRRICVITDTKVEKLYGKEVLARVLEVCPDARMCVIPEGEEHKNLDTMAGIYRFLIENGYDRKSLLVALGGGVVGDMTGFAAATYLRGVDYVQVPTTLLSQADSSIGGKTGIDFEGYKNMIGAFRMPGLVYSNVSTLKSLDGRQFSSGFAEVMKHGLIRDDSYYEWLLENMYEILGQESGVLQEMLLRSNQIKKEVVEADPLEKGERRILNLGHTIGHAIEKNSGFTLTHGECVALGCVAAAWISWKRDLIGMEDFYEIRDMFVPFGLPICLEELNVEKVLALTKSDKKAENGKINFVLLKGIGQAFVDDTVTDEEIRLALKELIFAEEG